MLAADRKRIVAVLEDEHESAEAAAEALWEEFVTIQEEKNTFWGVFIRFDNGTTKSYGPFRDKTKAKSAAKFFGLGENAVRQLHGVAHLRYKDETPEGSRYCDNCKHPRLAHFPGKDQCVVPKCTCQEKYK